MLGSFDDLTTEKIVAEALFEYPAPAARLLGELAGQGISDEQFETLLPRLIEALRATGDPDRALANLVQWLARVGSRASYIALLASHPAALEALLTLFSISQFFADLLARYPEHFEIVINPAIRDRPRDAASFLRDALLRIGIAKTPGAKRDALRRFKPPEILRIGARDLLGIAGTEEVAAEISDFAQACVQAAVSVAGAEQDFAVIALGKLGGRELNYASDIDLIYVHRDILPQERALALAEEITQTLSKATDAGFLFRVDLRLRPEGRFGAVSRSLAGCRAYYESWAEPWERQALLKARPIAGDAEVGAEFLKIAEPFVYKRVVDAEFVEAIRANKRRIERRAEKEGDADRNVKEGFGGIRDVEFIVQLFQLVLGAERPEIRSGATMEGLRRLASAGIISETAAGDLGESYLFLRDVEHRLQIMDERPIRDIPLDDLPALQKFARRLRYISAEEFLRDYRRHTRRANAYLQELFYGGAPGQAVAPPDEDAMISEFVQNIAAPGRREELARRLTGLSFADSAQAVRILERRVIGSEYGDIFPEARERWIALAPHLLRACAASGYPDDALKGIDLLASALPSSAMFFRSLQESPQLAERLTLLAGGAPALWQEIVHHPEFLDRIADDEALDPPSKPPSAPAAPRDVAGYVRRERLRLAALDLRGSSKPESLMRQASDIADYALLAAMGTVLQGEGLGTLENPAEPLPALIGLGKVGGQELGYGSDWDILWIAPGDAGADVSVSRRIAEGAMAYLNSDVKGLGTGVDVDARLRPEGRFGALTRTLPDYARYFETSADPWERQVLLKARVIGGNLDLGRRFLAQAAKIVTGRPPTAADLTQIRHLKTRMERERARSKSDIKLGPGGLSDIEWTTQLLQWKNAARWPRVLTPNTLAALKSLRDAAVLRQDDWETLSEAYVTLYNLRNRAWLRGDGVDEPAAQADWVKKMRERVRVVFERLF